MRRTTYLINLISLELVSEYPLWFILLCLLLGAGYAFALYYRARNQEVELWLRGLMAGFRFLSVSIIAFLLLSPLVKRTSEKIEKPVIILGVDNSGSMVLTADSQSCRNTLPAEVNRLADQLQKKYDVKTYSFGDRVSSGFAGTFSDKQTDISDFLKEVESRYSNRNVGAMILITDGIYNTGTDPFYAARRIPFPIYTVALGDTTVRKDIILKKVIYNKSVFIGDNFPVEALVEMDKCSGLTARVKVTRGEKVVYSGEVKAGNDHTLQKVNFILEAKSAGLQRYTIQADVIDGETNRVNNRQDFFVEVMNARQKVAILYDAPHPDISALEQALASSSCFEVSSFKTDVFNDPPAKFDLVILNQLPSVTAIYNLGELMKSPVSLLFIIGARTDINAFNNLKTGLIINSARTEYSDALPAYNAAFSIFSISQDALPIYREWPPLLSPFGAYQSGPLAEVLFYQQIGNVTTRTPLISFLNNPSKKIGIIAGENIWRWRISNFVQKGDHKSFDELFDKIVQYLAVKEDKSLFLLSVNPKFNENEPVEMDAVVLNPSYEMVNDQDVNITITDERKNNYPFVFSKSDKSYFLKAGLFPVGNYTFKATALQGKITHTRTGSFTVLPLNTESMNLVADHVLLKRISVAHGAEMVNLKQMPDLAAKLADREDIHSVSYTENRLSDLIGVPWIFLLILGLLTTEWVLRKRNGI